MKIQDIVKMTRENLKETATEFGTRFDVTHAAVGNWERGLRQPPSGVIEFCLDLHICSTCQGVGYIASCNLGDIKPGNINRKEQ